MGTPTPVPPVPAAPSTNILQRIGHDIEVGAIDIERFVTSLPKIIAAWNTLAPQVKAVSVQLLHDVDKAVQAARIEAGDVASGNFLGAITLAPATLVSLQQLYADAEAGEQEIVASFKVLSFKR